MKQIVLGAIAALGVTAFTAPAQAALFKWNVEYSGFFTDGAAITGFFVADETAAADGIVSGDEFDGWEWNWSGNSEVDAFTVASSNGEFATLFDTPGFYVDGTLNNVGLADGLDQGFYFSDNFGVDLEFLIVESFATGSPITGTATVGDITTVGTIAVADPVPVPEPATLLGLLAMAGGVAAVKRQKHAV